ncbi:hypothetical protein [Fodinicola feengrottensis]|uniref:Uncharacterized protein n=1 Tax=Fodinicola feengrottensis TaxID=435914 RepID=A0ABN2H377_9ACTN|nr:hypothetical protein [Fodinicola feengrottensis]
MPVDPSQSSELDPSEHPGSRTQRRRRRRQVTRLTIVAVAAALVVGLLLAPVVRNLVWGSGGSANTPVAMSSSQAASLFAGTPAASFAIGDAGIQLPAAQQQGSYSAADVGTATQLTKQTLVAARLDPAMLQRGDLSGYLAKLAPSLQPMVTSAVQKGGGALSYVTRLAPTAKLAVDEIRVSGTMSVSVGSDGQLVISANYTWVYPLDRAGGKPKGSPPLGSNLVIVHTVETYEWYQQAKVAATERGLRTGGGNSYAYNKDCNQFGRGYLALAPLAADGHADAPAAKAYDPKTDPNTLPGPC